MEQLRGGDLTLRQKLQHIGSKFIAGTEISAQEATYCTLGMRLSESSNAEVYINTSRPEDRVRMLKPRQQLENMDPQATNIFEAGLLDHYEQRPDELEQVSLADFASYYIFSRKQTQAGQTEDYEEAEEENVVPTAALRLKDGSGFLRKRTKGCIIRYRRFNVNTHRSDYFRELRMLYFP